MCSRYWSSSFFPCGDDVGLGGFCIFLPLSAGDCIITLCNLQGVIRRFRCYVLQMGCYTARCINNSWALPLKMQTSFLQKQIEVTPQTVGLQTPEFRVLPNSVFLGLVLVRSK